MNRVELVGRLTKDIELKKTQSGLSVASFTIAVNRRGGDQTADFIACVAWRQSAEYLANYGKKGSVVALEGRIQTRNYDQNGHKVYVTEIVADSVSLIGGKKEVPEKPMDYETPEKGADAWNMEQENLPF